MKITNQQITMIKNHCKLLKYRIETEHNNISYSDMLRILSKIEDRFNIMLEEVFEVFKQNEDGE